MSIQIRYFEIKTVEKFVFLFNLLLRNLNK